MTEQDAQWYPDPTGRHDHRYWDGLTWTEHVADGGVIGTNSPYLEQPTSEPVPRPVVPGAAPGPAGSARSARRWVGAGLLVVVVVVVAAFLVGHDDSDGSGLAGRWVSKGYTCPAGVLRREVIRIEQQGHHIVGTKVVGDDCVRAGHVSFEGDVNGTTGLVDVWAAQPHTKPYVAARGQRITLQDANHLTVAYGGLTMPLTRDHGGGPSFPWFLFGLLVAAIAAIGVVVVRRRRASAA